MPDVTIAGATYPDVPAVDLPRADGVGNARYYEPSEILYAASPTSGGPATVTNGVHIAKVDSTSTSKVFTAQIPGITSYYDGLKVLLYNGVVTSASGFTININGLGAYGAYSNMALGNASTPTDPTRETTIFNINYAMEFIFYTNIGGDGVSGWICYRGYDANTNTIGYQLRTNSTVRKTTDKFRYYKILFSSLDNTHWVPASTATDNSATSTKTVNQRPINPFGEIVYCSVTTSYAAEADVTATGVWQEYTCTLGYSFNRTGAALSLTTRTPVYIKCAPQSDGSAIIDSTTPYVQALPSTDDGKIYIFLGVAYSATAVELTMKHPVFYHDGTGIRIWTGKIIPAKTSELTNDSGFITSAPVTSVNGQTGAVTIPALPTVSSSDNGKFLRVVSGVWDAATVPNANGVSF